uniref:Uncharacterized protein n=1 Tax=Arundo donax TaxID=35708 RepID=A0A0A9DXF5_ARUDO
MLNLFNLLLPRTRLSLLWGYLRTMLLFALCNKLYFMIQQCKFNYIIAISFFQCL